MKKKELLPALEKEAIENLIKFLRVNYSDEVDWDAEYCCASDALDGGLDIAVKVLEKGYGLRPEIDPPKDEEEEEDDE